jgi:hypothetical protein
VISWKSWKCPASHRFLALLGALFFWSAMALAARLADPLMAGQTLKSGFCLLTIATNPASGGVDVWLPSKTGPTADFQAIKPLAVEMLDAAGATNWLATGYSSVIRVDRALRCTGQIRTANGTVVNFNDTYNAGKQADTFLLEREVSVEMAGTNDAGFMTCFRLESSQPSPLRN